MKVAHIVNPVKVPASHELSIAQPITYETMRYAKKFAKKTKKIDVELWCTGYPEDEAIFPEGFNVAPLLDKSILDYYEFGSAQRKLPLFRHILDRLYESTDADYLIQTNVDIGLMPHFYTTVARLIDKGFDALVINKRIIWHKYKSVEDIPLMYCEPGKDHNGCDCFVFKRDVYPEYELGDICMGTPWSETILVANMIAYSIKFRHFVKSHFTFHIGDSRTWLPLADYRRFNTEEFGRIYTQLLADKPWLNNSETLKIFVMKMLNELNDDYSDYCQDLADGTVMLF